MDLYALDETYELIYANDDVRIYDAGWRRCDGAILQYSLEQDCKICVVLMTDRQMKRSTCA